MRFRRYVCLALLAATAVLAFGAAGANSSSIAPKSHVATATAGKVGVKYTIKKFVRSGHRLVAYGTATPRFTSTSGAVTKGRPTMFKAAVAIRTRHLSAAAQKPQQICPILDLTLGPLDLNLLGLMVHLDQVHLVITADSEGGLLGNLLCNLSKQGKLTAQTKKLNWVVQKSGLSTTGAGVVVSVQPQEAGSAGPGSTPKAISPQIICTVLELTLGPIDLNLLGLMVHLDTVHLLITADSEGGLLGQLLCPGIAGGGG